MVENKKKLIPKLKKKIWAFLTDESWKITKKDALWLWVWAMMMGVVDETIAGHSNWCSAPTSNPQYWPTPDDVTDNSNWTPERDTNCYTIWNVTVSHASWIVNGHYSNTPWYAWWKANIWHSSHWSHGSHWSHWSHWSHGSHGSHWSRW